MSHLTTSFPWLFTLGVASAFAWIVLIPRLRPAPVPSTESVRLRPVDALLSSLVAGVLAARLGYAGLHLATFSRTPASVLALWQGGLVGWAGIIGGSLGLIAYCRLTGARFWPLADKLAAPAAIIALGSWSGCLLDGCAYGRSVTDSALAIGGPDWTGVVQRRWPTQSIGALSAVAAIAWVSLGNWEHSSSGVPASLTLCILALGGLVAGLLRADPVAPIAGIRNDVLGNGLLLAGGIALAAWRSRQA